MIQKIRLLGVLVLFLFFVQSSSAAINIIGSGGDIFIGEEGLDTRSTVGGSQSVAWFASGTNPNTDIPNYVIPVGNPASFYVAPYDFVGCCWLLSVPSDEEGGRIHPAEITKRISRNIAIVNSDFAIIISLSVYIKF